MVLQYQDLHRYFLQSIMSKGIMKEKNAREVFARACAKYNVEHRAEDFHSIVEAINKNLKDLYMEIRQGKSEEDGVSYYALVNCAEDEHSKLATDFSANEIAFFKKALELIITSDDGCMSSMNLVNSGLELEPRMTASTSENLLATLVREKWLTEIDGEFSLGARTIIELSMYLKNIYQDEIPDCKMCMRIVIKGQTCANCGIRIHLYCAATLFKRKSPESRKCPGCQTQWHHDVPNINVGTVERENGDEVMEVDESPEPRPSISRLVRSANSRPTRSRR